MAKFQIPRGQLIGAIYLVPGTIIDNASGSFKVTYAPDGSNVGNTFPTFSPGPDAIPYDQSSYNVLRTKYPNRQIVTHNDAVAGITRTPDA